MALRTSSNGKLLYIYQAGNTIDLYEAATYKYLRTITLDADMTTELFVWSCRRRRRQRHRRHVIWRAPARRSRYLVPYWRRLALVVVLSVVSTALSLALPYLSKTLIDTRAGRTRSRRALSRPSRCSRCASVAGFVLNAVTGLRYTRVSADILFDMRLALYRHLQRLSPRFYARTPLGDILSRASTTMSAKSSASRPSRCSRGSATSCSWSAACGDAAGSTARLALVALAHGAARASGRCRASARRRLETRVATLRERARRSAAS